MPSVVDPVPVTIHFKDGRTEERTYTSLPALVADAPQNSPDVLIVRVNVEHSLGAADAGTSDCVRIGAELCEASLGPEGVELSPEGVEPEPADRGASDIVRMDAELTDPGDACRAQ